MKKFITLVIATVVLGACTNKKHSTDYREIAFQQNELICVYEEKVEELESLIRAAFPGYMSDDSEIDSLNYVLDSLYLVIDN